jgi:osmotically-inducible protein OsmY
VSVIVENGAVDFTGFVPSEEIRQALRAVARTVPGVRSVTDHMHVGLPVWGA